MYLRISTHSSFCYSVNCITMGFFLHLFFAALFSHSSFFDFLSISFHFSYIHIYIHIHMYNVAKIEVFPSLITYNAALFILLHFLICVYKFFGFLFFCFFFFVLGFCQFLFCKKFSFCLKSCI